MTRNNYFFNVLSREESWASFVSWHICIAPTLKQVWRSGHVPDARAIWSKHSHKDNPLVTSHIPYPSLCLWYWLYNSQIHTFLGFPGEKIPRKKTKLTSKCARALEESQCKSRKIVFWELGLCRYYKKLHESLVSNLHGFPVARFSAEAIVVMKAVH